MQLNPTAYRFRLAKLGAAALAAALLLHPLTAHAANGGGAMPWDAPLTTFKNDIIGPVAFTISLLAFFAAGATLIFGGEISEFVRRLLLVVVVAALLVGITTVASALGIAGAIIT